MSSETNTTDHKLRVAILVPPDWETVVSGVGTFLRLIIPALRERFDLVVVPVGTGSGQGAAIKVPEENSEGQVASGKRRSANGGGAGGARLLFGYIRDCLAEYRQLRRHRSKADVVICNEFGAETLPIAARLAFPRAKLLCISHTHPGENQEALHSVRRRIEKISCRAPHSTVFNSNALKETWEARLGYSPGKSKVIWHGIGEPDRGVPTDYPPKKPRNVDFVYLGQFYSWKGQCEFLDAWKLAMDAMHDPDILPRLIFIGDGKRLEEAVGKATALGLQQSVIFMGRKADGAKYLNNADVLVLMSTEPEAFGFVVLEAMSRGVPVIATNKGGPGEVLAHGGGNEADPSDLAKVAEVVIHMFDPLQRAELGSAGRAAFVNYFTLRAMVSKYHTFIRTNSGQRIAPSERIEVDLTWLGPNARVLDVGGGNHAHSRANYVLDITMPDGARNADTGNRHLAPQSSWLNMDICSGEPWPFPDKYFDYAICSHVLEDVRDPVWVCSEMSRIAKRGYIECPSRIVEQSTGVENPLYAGYYHHRWLVDVRDGMLEFRVKPHSISAYSDCIVCKLRPNQWIAPEIDRIAVEWDRVVQCREIIEIDEKKTIEEMAEYATKARKAKQLKKAFVSEGRWHVFKMQIFYWRTLLTRNTRR